MDIQEAISKVSDEQWSALAKATGMTPEEVRTQWESALRDMQDNPEQKPEVIRGQADDVTGDAVIEYQWGPANILLLKLGYTFGEGSNWSAEFIVTLQIFSSTVWSSGMQYLNPGNSSVHLQPTVSTLINVDMYVTIKPPTHTQSVDEGPSVLLRGSGTILNDPFKFDHGVPIN